MREQVSNVVRDASEPHEAEVLRWAGPGSVPDLGPAACAIGVFDGFHRGHAFLVGSMREDARRRGVASVVVTFDKDPDEFFFADGIWPNKLLDDHDRIRLIARSGVDYVLVVPFDGELAALPYDAFLEDVLGQAMEMRAIHVGRDFRLGHKAEGTVDALRAWGGRHACEVIGYDLLEEDGETVCSTRIRALLAEGDAQGAARLLGRPYFVKGTVVEGRHEGTKMGFPTANVAPEVGYVSVADGVYAGWCAVGGICYPAAINAGYPPTFAGERRLCRLEPHIIDFEGDLYGSQLAVSFGPRLRGPVKFESLDALIEAVKGNIAWTRAHLTRLPADELGFPLGDAGAAGPRAEG